jgi:Tfp pilus assembly protein PilE
MLHSLCNKKGVTLVEVLTAIVLTSIGIMSLLALQNPGWKNVARADYMGRATAILNKTFESYETLILNPCENIAPYVGTPSTFLHVHPSDQTTAISGDVEYTVVTNIDYDGVSTTAFVVTVTVSWPPINTAGITESLTVTRQEFDRYPLVPRCGDNTLNDMSNIKL